MITKWPLNCDDRTCCSTVRDFVCNGFGYAILYVLFKKTSIRHSRVKVKKLTYSYKLTVFTCSFTRSGCIREGFNQLQLQRIIFYTILVYFLLCYKNDKVMKY